MLRTVPGQNKAGTKDGPGLGQDNFVRDRIGQDQYINID